LRTQSVPGRIYLSRSSAMKLYTLEIILISSSYLIIKNNQEKKLNIEETNEKTLLNPNFDWNKACYKLSRRHPSRKTVVLGNGISSLDNHWHRWQTWLQQFHSWIMQLNKRISYQFLDFPVI
jgi:hypothetical protein